MRPASCNHPGEGSEEGTLLRLKSTQDECAEALHHDLGEVDFSKVSAVLKTKLLHFKFIKGLGSGGFGAVFMVESDGNDGGQSPFLAVKVEVLKERESPALNGEACVLMKHSRATRDDVPLTKVRNAISLVRTGHRDFFASISLESGKTVNLMCIELLDTETPDKIWKEGAKQLADNLVVTASLRYLILEALHALLYLLQKGIAHRDLKWPHHLGLRHDSKQLVVFDFGMAEQNGTIYESAVKVKKPRQQKPAWPMLTTGCSLVQAETTQLRIGGEQPGTPGFRAPFKAITLELGQRADIWSAAASMTKLIRKGLKSEEFERRLHAVVQRQNFEEFLDFVLEGNDRSRMKVSCHRLLTLAYHMFQSILGKPRLSPVEAITTALFSEFALSYIFED